MTRPTCQADGCDRKATEQIHNVLIDGQTFSVYTCGDHYRTGA